MAQCFALFRGVDGEITAILEAVKNGEPGAAEKLWRLVYDQLRRLARSKMAHQPASPTFQPTELVHEVWAKLGGHEQKNWSGRSGFFAAAATAMRCILIDRARRKLAIAHGGGVTHMNADDVAIAAPQTSEQILKVNDALERFSTKHPQKAKLVELRYFAGFTIEEAADALEIGHSTAERWWDFSRAWLLADMNVNL